MKLKNKKTGKITEIEEVNLVVMNDECDCYESFAEYHSLAELNADWEDYVPAEPIINETDVRHILKLWASTNHIPHNSNEIEVCLIDSQKGTITQFYSDGLYAHFWGKVAPDAISGKCYTIDELCGEDEE
jgi:hypothetical protein